MARFKVLKPPTLLDVSQGVRADLGKLAGEPATRVVEAALKPIVQGHYDNLVKQIGLKLRGIGMPAGVSTGGKKGISYGTPDGGVSRFTTSPWRPLTPRYAMSNPSSYKFWKKTGILSHAYDTQVLDRYPVQVQELKAARNHHRNRVNTKFILGFTPLEFPFEMGVTLPFVRGANAFKRTFSSQDFGPMEDLSKTINRNGLGRARFAELNGRGTGRPFMRQLSALLGQQMRSDITKKLRKL